MKRFLSLILPFAVSRLVDAADPSEPHSQVSPDREPARNPETFELRIDHVAIGVPDLKATVRPPTVEPRMAEKAAMIEGSVGDTRGYSFE
jgi:hypothetical protein